MDTTDPKQAATSTDTDAGESTLPPRRGFLVRASAAVVGLLIGVVPAVAALLTVFDPLKRKSAAADYVPVTTLDALPKDGSPVKFIVRKDTVDAWTTIPQARVGAVYLRKTGESVEALNVVCPHAGCAVAAIDDGAFVCPCHESEFNPDGTKRPINRHGRATKAPRDLDSLDVKVDNTGQVLVKFQNFRIGIDEKIPQ